MAPLCGLFLQITHYPQPKISIHLVESGIAQSQLDLRRWIPHARVAVALDEQVQFVAVRQTTV
jgi:hypothetical protein